jgi:hypothetical protein
VRILFACHFKYNMHYGIMHKLVHGLTRQGHNVMLFDDRRVARAATIFNSRKGGIGSANKRLYEACAQFQPELLVLGHCEMIQNITLDLIRKAVPNIRIVYRNDDPLMHTQNVKDIHNRTKSVDWIFITTAGKDLQQFSGQRAKISHVPNPTDRVIDAGKNFEHSNQPHDVFYGIGGVYKGDPRPAFMENIRNACPETRFDIRGMLGKPNVFGVGYYATLSQAKMGLNYSRENNVYLYSSDRMAQYMGNGLLTFVDRATGFPELFSEDQVGFYSTPEELAEKIRFYTANDTTRKAVAYQGWQRIHDIFASEKVGQYMVDCALEQKHSFSYAWPTTVY